MQFVVLLAAAWLLALVAWGDLRARRIPNELSFAVAALALARMALYGDLAMAAYTLAAVVLVFLICFFLFSRGVLGGGDVKLLTSVALLVGYGGLVELVFVMSLCGLVLALLVLAEDRAKRFLRRTNLATMRLLGTAASPARPTVPYGVAIAIAGVWVLLRQTQIG